MMSPTKVVHFKREKFDVYIGRPQKFGNPFTFKEPHNEDYFFVCETREEAVVKYKFWLYQRLATDREFMKAFCHLGGCILGCWCAPKLCHGDVIVQALDKIDIAGLGRGWNKMINHDRQYDKVQKLFQKEYEKMEKDYNDLFTS